MATARKADLKIKSTNFTGDDGKLIYPRAHYDHIDGKPTSFTPTLHDHSISEITGLQGALDGKAFKVHTHTIANITDLSAGTLLEATAGSVTAQRAWSPKILKEAIQALSDLDTDTNTYLSSLGFNTSTGVLTATLNNSSTVTIDIDGRYSQSIHEHDYLRSIDDRDVKPNNLSYNRLQTYFTSLEGLTAATGSDYQDLLVLNTYSDSSGGRVNALAFDKSEMKIRYYQALQTDTSWGTPKTLAYAEEVLPLTGGTLTGTLTGTTFVGALTGTASGNLTSSSTLDATKLSGAIPSAVTATTQAVADNSTKIATTAYVKAQGYSKTVGTVTGVSMTVPTGLSVSGSPVVSSGTLAVSFASGYSIPTTASQTSWNTAVTATDEATSGNTGNAIVKRDASGNFSAGTITASLTGTASGNLTSSSTLDASKLSGAITNGVTATTQATADNTTKIATTAFVKAQNYLTSLPSHALSAHSDVSATSPTTGQVLKWNGTAWAPGADNNSTYNLGSFGVTASAAQLNFTTGVTSNIQTQLDGKAASSHSHEWSEITGIVPTWNQNTTGSASKWNGQSFYTPDTPVNGDVMRFSSAIGWYAGDFTPTSIGAAEATHPHGAITSDGVILASGQATIATGDKLVFIDSDDESKIKRATYSFDGSTTTFLRGDGQFATPTTSAASQVNITSNTVTGDFNYITMVKGSSGGQNVYVDSDIRFDGSTNQLKVGGFPLLRRNASWYSTSVVNSRTYSRGYMTTDDGIKIQWGTIQGSGSTTAKTVSFQTGTNVTFTNTPSIVMTNMRAGSTTATVISSKITASSTTGFSFIGSYVTASSAGFTPTAEEYTWIAIGR